MQHCELGQRKLGSYINGALLNYGKKSKRGNSAENREKCINTDELFRFYHSYQVGAERQIPALIWPCVCQEDVVILSTLNHSRKTNGAETRTGIMKTMTPKSEPGTGRHDNSKGHLIHTRNSFLFPVQGRSHLYLGRGQDRCRTKNKLPRFTTSAAMKSGTSSLQRPRF